MADSKKHPSEDDASELPPKRATRENDSLHRINDASQEVVSEAASSEMRATEESPLWPQTSPSWLDEYDYDEASGWYMPSANVAVV